MKLRLIASPQVGQIRTMTLYHGTKSPELVLAQGFDLSKIKPRWSNDLAVSTMTSPKPIYRFFADQTIPIIQMTFTGRIATQAEASQVARSMGTKGAQAFTNAMLKAGIDATISEGDRGPYVVFVYNVGCLSNLKLWTPPTKT